jgi:hypothetical protein
LIAVPTLVVEDGAFMFFTAPTPLGALFTIERTAGVTVLRAICAGVVAIELVNRLALALVTAGVAGFGVVAIELVNRLALALVTAGVAGFGAGEPFLLELVELVELFFVEELVDPVFLIAISSSSLWFYPSCSSHRRDQLCRLWRNP